MTAPELLEEVSARLGERLRSAYDQAAIRRAALERAALLSGQRDEVEAEADVNRQALVILQTVEQVQHAQVGQRVEALVSYALRTIFDRDVKFEVVLDTRGGQTEAKFRLRDELGTQMPLRDAHGGGLLAVVSFILRVIVLLSVRPQLRPVMFVDEPFVQVSEEYRDKLISFIQALAGSSGLQFVIVTHLPELAAVGDKRYRFKLVDGRTNVEEV